MMQAHTQMTRGLLLLTVSAGAMSPAVRQELVTIADMALIFGVRTIGTEFETSMMISKFKNAPENLKLIVYRVTPEEGITPETVERIA